MNKLIFLLFIALFVNTNFLFSQSSEALSLNDSMKRYYPIDKEKSKMFGNQGLAIAIREKDIATEALLYKSFAANSINWDEPDSSLFYLEKAVPIFHALQDTFNIIHCQRIKISAWQQKEEYDTAIVACKELMNNPFVRKRPDVYYRMMQNLAIMYGSIDLYQSAITIYKEAFQYFLSQQDTLDIIHSCNDIILLSGLTNYENGFEESIQLFELALPLTIATNDLQSQAQLLSRISNVYLEQGKMEDAKKMMEQSLSIREELQDKVSLSYGYQDMATIYMKEENYDMALDYVYRSLQIDSECKNHSLICYDFELMGKLFQNKNEHNQAINYFDQAIKIATEFHFGQQLLDCMQAKIISLSAIGKIDEANADFYQYLDTYEKLSESDQIEKRFWEEEIELREAQKQEVIKEKQHRLSVIQTLIICVGLIVFCWLFFSMGKRHAPSKNHDRKNNSNNDSEIHS